MRQPKSLSEAKQMFSAEKARVASSISVIAGSRWLMAILAALVVTFGCHLLYAPNRLPGIEWLHWQSIGLPPSVDFGFAGEQFEQAREAAQRNDVAGHVQAALAEHPERYVLINSIVFVVAGVLLAINMWIMTKRRRYTRG